MASSNQAAITNFLATKGFSDAQIAGIEGNLWVESGFDPTNVNPGEGAVGIVQWEGPRRTALDNYATKTGGTEKSLNTQLGFMWQELNTSEKGAFTKFLANSDTPEAAAASWDQYYERSAGTARGTRIKKAKEFFSGGSSSGSSGGGGGDVSLDHTGSAEQAGLLPGPVGGIIGDATGAVGGAIGKGLRAGAGAATDAVVSPVVDAAKPLVFKSLVGLTAGALVVLGVYKMFAPTIKAGADKVSSAAGSAAKLAALA